MPPRPSPFGSLLCWELVRLARRGLALRTRILFLYLLVLVATLFSVWWAPPAALSGLFRGDRHGPDYFAETLALVLLETQLLFVAVFAPAFGALAISEEKDRKTLSLLLTTELDDSDIVWGKTLSRVLLMLAAAAAGAPLLVLCWLFGLATFESIAISVLLTLGTTVLSVAIGVYAGCHCPDTRSALLRSYATSAVLVFGLPFFVKLTSFAVLGYTFGYDAPFGIKLDLPAVRLGAGLSYAALQVALGYLFVAWGTGSLRPRESTAGRMDPSEYPEPPRGRAEPLVVSRPGTRTRPYPPLGLTNPVLWKERHVARQPLLPVLDTTARWLANILAALAAVLFVVGVWQLLDRTVASFDLEKIHSLSHQGIERPLRGGWLLAAGIVLTVLTLVPLVTGIAGCVAGERARQTLDSLLMVPLSRRTLVWSKVKAHLERSLGFGIAALAAIGGDFIARGGVKCGLSVMVSVAAATWFVMADAVLLSVRCATPGRAFWLALLPLVGVIALPLLVWSLIDWANEAPALQLLNWLSAILLVLGCWLWWRAIVELNRCQ